jgi:hypothetical protein
MNNYCFFKLIEERKGDISIICKNGTLMGVSYLLEQNEIIKENIKEKVLNLEDYSLNAVKMFLGYIYTSSVTFGFINLNEQTIQAIVENSDWESIKDFAIDICHCDEICKKFNINHILKYYIDKMVDMEIYDSVACIEAHSINFLIIINYTQEKNIIIEESKMNSMIEFIKENAIHVKSINII